MLERGEQSALLFTVAPCPAGRIFSMPGTGNGAFREGEVVVLGGKDTMNVRVFGVWFSGSEGRQRRWLTMSPLATLNEDWIKTLGWDLPTDPGRAVVCHRCGER